MSVMAKCNHYNIMSVPMVFLGITAFAFGTCFSWFLAWLLAAPVYDDGEEEQEYDDKPAGDEDGEFLHELD